MAIQTLTGPTAFSQITDSGFGINDFLSNRQGVIDIRSKGAKCDGKTDDSQAINDAIAVAALSGSKVALPNTGANIVVANPIVLIGGVTVEGFDNPAIFLANNANCPVMQSSGFTSGANQNDIVLRNFIINGNSSNQSSTAPNSVGADYQNGINIFGVHTVMENISIHDVLGHGIRRAGTDPAGTEPNQSVEDMWLNVKTVRTGRHGVWLDGTQTYSSISDGGYTNLWTVDASQSTDNTYYGLYATTTGRFFNFHGWHSSQATNRVAYQVWSNGGCEFVCSHFEGGRSCFYHNGANDQIVASRFYANFSSTAGSAMEVFAGGGNTSSANQFDGAPNAGNQVYAIQIGITGTSSALNTITNNLFINVPTYGPFNFLTDGGYNVVSGVGYMISGGATSFGGTVASTTSISYNQGGTVIAVNTFNGSSVITQGGSGGTAASITYTGSPFAYTASARGVYTIFGGTISAITLKRGSTTASLNTSTSTVDLVSGDILTITYSVAPTSTFFPS